MTARPRWVRPGLDIEDGRLRIAGRDAESLARERATPLFVYDRTRFAENARALQGALAGTGLPFRVRFALKTEGDIVATLNAGGYLQAMSSTHCLRPMAEAVFLDR